VQRDSLRRHRYNRLVLPGVYQLPAGVVFVLGGALACFAGYRLFKAVLGVFGFILGALIATSVLPPSGTTAALVTGLAGGLAGAAILLLSYFVGVAFAGAALAAVAVNIVAGQLGREPHVLVVVGACVLGAWIAMALQRQVIIAATAFGGAWTLVVGVLLVAGPRLLPGPTPKAGDWLAYPLDPAPEHRWVQLAWIVVGAVGLLVQLRTGKKKGTKKKGKKSKE
jgi:MFS family permease